MERDRDTNIELMMIRVDLLKEAMNKIWMDVHKLEIEINRFKSPFSLAERRQKSLEMYRVEYQRQFGNVHTYDVEDEDMIG